MTPSVKIKFFASLKDLAPSPEIEWPLTEDLHTIADLRADLSAKLPALAPALPSAISALNHEYVFPEQSIQNGDEIAFFPPVSGGSDAAPLYCALSDGAVDLNSLTARIVTPATGAIALFSGFVRGQTQNPAAHQFHETLRLEYEAYEPMAIAKMEQVAAEIRAQWPQVLGIAIVQSIGILEVGQPTVLIACGAGHRDDGAFEAARYGIDRLKEIVPVWKKEIQADGSSWVAGHYQPRLTDRADQNS